MASGLGFEPRFSGPEPEVLPLDDPEILHYFVRLSSNSLPLPDLKKRSRFIDSDLEMYFSL